ncbi:hypothetical protein [Nonomuraea rhizosphaerae]|uniref:hypothetical protein n=1 Tax=Nonomuraea rhizosphaerae TaxID=2665663 RepID=UPI001C5E518A|nr:hypothetical protein [Nonomuraea rhizosphaerae]
MSEEEGLEQPREQPGETPPEPVPPEPAQQRSAAEDAPEDVAEDIAGDAAEDAAEEERPAEEPEETDGRPPEERGLEEERNRRFRLEGLAVAYDVAGTGANVAHGDQTVHQHFGDRHFGERARTARLVTLLTPAHVDGIRRLTVPTRSRRTLAERLMNNDVVVLCGPRRSGRATTALAALLDWAGEPGRSPLGTLNTARDLSELTAADLAGARGYLLDDTADGPDLGRLIPQLREVAFTAKCRIVVLTRSSGATGHVEVEHDPPPVGAVFAAWLRDELGSPERVDELGLREHPPRLTEQLDGCSPGRARWLAARIAEERRRGVPLDKVLESLDRPSRERLSEALGPGANSLSRCFLLSSGVLHGLSEATVSQAALRLDALIREQVHEQRRPRLRVWDSLETWLHYDGVRTEPSSAPGDAQRIWLRPDAKPLVLQVAWAKQPALRELLYEWLRELTASGEQRVAIRAAQAVAQLAACDFATAKAEFLDPWTGTVHGRRMARCALEAAFVNPDLAGRVHQLLDDWSKGNYQHRLAVAAVYGSRIGIQAVGRALETFHEIASHSTSRGLHETVADAVTEVYTAETADEVLETLARWAGDKNVWVRQTAALALIWLAYLPEGRPALMESDRVAALGTLWGNALLWAHDRRKDGRYRAATAAVWQLLTRWAACPQVIRETFGLVGGRHPELDKALAFQLRFWLARGVVTAEERVALHGLLRQGERR